MHYQAILFGLIPIHHHMYALKHVCFEKNTKSKNDYSIIPPCFSIFINGGK